MLAVPSVRRRPVAIILAVLAVVLFLAAGARAGTTTETAHAGNVVARFSFEGSGTSATSLQLQIQRAEQVLYDRPVTSSECSPYCQPADFGAHPSSVRVVDLEHDGRPDVVLELFSGGANCCFIDQVFSFKKALNTYVRNQHNFASAGARIERIGTPRRWRLVSADDNFKYLFTDGADSGEPIQIWRFANRRFSDVTRGYRALVAANAAFWLKTFNHHLANGVGFIAAWAADEELLGHNALVQSRLASESTQGHLRDGGNGLATGKKFVAELNHYLRKLGYRH